MIKKTGNYLQKKSNNIMHHLQKIFELYPAFLILINVIATIFFTNIFFIHSSLFLVVILSLVIMTLLFGFNYLLNKKNYWKLIVNISVIILTLSFTLNQKHYLKKQNINLPQAQYLTATVKITDYSACGDEVNFLKNPNIIRAKILAIRNQNNLVECDLKGQNIVLKMPKEFRHIAYNDYLEVTGTLQKMSENIITTKYDFTAKDPQITTSFNEAENGFYNYLKIKDISGIFRVDEATILQRKQFSVIEGIFSIRNYIINRLCKYLDTPQQKTLICAMFFGIKQNLTSEDKRNFINNGIIHLFTVSGLHAAMVAIIISLIFRVIPFRFRHILIILALICYLIMTGSNPPAVRAVTMISTVLLCRALRLKTPILNILALTATFFLIINPLLIADIGFNYSFIIVFFLIIFAQHFQKIRLILFEKSNYHGNNQSKRRYIQKINFINKNVSFVMGCIVAFFASSLISIKSYRAFFAISVLVNIMLSPLVWLLYTVVAVQLLGCYSDTLLYYTSKVNAFLINCIFNTSQYFSAKFPPQATGDISIIQLIIIFILLTGIIIGKKRIAITSLILMLMSITYNYMGIIKQKEHNRIFVIFSSSDYAPSLIILPKNFYYSTIINTGSFNTTNTMTNIIKRYNSNNELICYFTGAKKMYLENATWLLKNHNIKELFITQKEKNRSIYGRKLIDFCEQKDVKVNLFTKITESVGDKSSSQRYCYMSDFYRQKLLITKNLGDYSYKNNYNHKKDNLQFINSEYSLEVDGINNFGQGKIIFQEFKDNKKNRTLSFTHNFYSSATTNIIEIVF